MDETAPEEVLLDGNAEARASDFYMPSGVEVRGASAKSWASTRRFVSSLCSICFGRHSFLFTVL